MSTETLKEAILEVKSNVIKVGGEAFYYEEIGQRIKCIKEMNEEYQKAKKIAEEVFEISGIDHLLSFRSSVMQHVIISFEDQSKKKQVYEFAMYQLAMDAYEELEL